MQYFILLTFIVAIFLFIAGAINNNKKKYQDEKYIKNLAVIRKFFEEIESFDDYVTWKKRDSILKKYKPQHDFFEGKSSYYSGERDVARFNSTYEKFKEYVDDYNESYVDRVIEENSGFFDNIEGNSLDRQQREAVVTDEYSNLVVAGAGSGKTLTILGKVLYLTKIKKVRPDRILLMSYTRKTVEDLNDRLKAIPSSARATTFHKLGLGIITDYEGDRPNVAGEELLGNVVKNYLKDEISEHPEQVQALVQFIACYSNIPEDYDNFQSAGERFDFYRGSVDYETLRSKVHNANGVRQTLAGERVRSVEELMIANFLYLNGVKYEYEKKYPYSDFSYYPDFYLPDYDIWLEHFGVDENGEAKWLNAYDSKKYSQEMVSKREVHRQNGTTLLETYSYYNKQHRLLSELETMLLKHGVKLERIDVNEVYDAVSQDKYFGYQLRDLIVSFVNLCKSRDLSEDEIKKLFLNGHKDKFMAERSRLFFEFAFPIIKRYQKALDEDKSIDFHDMINHAADIVKKHGCQKYDYVIVDEYQDISYSRFNLMNAIREHTDAKVLCVGDDWQSIYRFAGSDISLFSEFGKFVGEYKQLLIERTFRNSQELVDMASAFIQKNPMQIKKQPRSDKHMSDPISFVQYGAGEYIEIYKVFIQQVEQLIAKYGEDASIMVLGRHSFDVDALLYMESDKIRRRGGIRLDSSTGKLTINDLNGYDKLYFSTVHKAKGLQADNVIVLHMENSQYGFPNKLTDDPMLAPLLSEQEDYRYAEERRLFYVAITRTKGEVILLSPSTNESEFFMEMLNDNQYVLSDDGNSSKQVNCPWCETGKLVVRRNGTTGEQFLGCSHYPQCNQSYKDVSILKYHIHCSRCGSGFMVKRKGAYGEFLGCTNWKPHNRGCSNTIRLDKGH